MAVETQTPLDAARVKLDFPILAKPVHGKPLVYLDSANSSQKPRAVIEAMTGKKVSLVPMALALGATLLDRQIVSFGIIVAGTLVGAGIGIYFARTVQMTAMPQMVALFNGMGGGTAALVSVAEYLRLTAGVGAGAVSGGEAASIGLGTAIGAISFTGSLIAFGKLQELLSGKPLQFPLQRALNALILLSMIALGVTIALGHGGPFALWLLFAAALVLGALFVLPIGGGDMPVVISILNSLTGLAAALTGFVLHNQMLVVAGVLVDKAHGERLDRLAHVAGHQADDEARVEPAREHRPKGHVAHQAQAHRLLELGERAARGVAIRAPAAERRGVAKAIALQVVVVDLADALDPQRR